MGPGNCSGSSPEVQCLSAESRLPPPPPPQQDQGQQGRKGKAGGMAGIDVGGLGEDPNEESARELAAAGGVKVGTGPTRQTRANTDMCPS